MHTLEILSDMCPLCPPSKSKSIQTVHILYIFTGSHLKRVYGGQQGQILTTKAKTENFPHHESIHYMEPHLHWFTCYNTFLVPVLMCLIWFKTTGHLTVKHLTSDRCARHLRSASHFLSCSACCLCSHTDNSLIPNCLERSSVTAVKTLKWCFLLLPRTVFVPCDFLWQGGRSEVGMLGPFSTRKAFLSILQSDL